MQQKEERPGRPLKPLFYPRAGAGGTASHFPSADFVAARKHEQAFICIYICTNVVLFRATVVLRCTMVGREKS
ncbi:hypothetical protein IM543_06630 [Massilia sp. UMI-21]|nr:hypothetical protein IM543_06630 [Massilia sp. UMI-21]